MNDQEIKDKLLLNELVNKISVLADNKEFQKQSELFTENAISETYFHGTALLKLNGRKEMIQAFHDFLKNFDTVFHFNGQQLVELNGNKATGVCYSLITLIETIEGRKVQTRIGAIYRDNYVKDNGVWLVSKRIGDFRWQEKAELQKESF